MKFSLNNLNNFIDLSNYLNQSEELSHKLSSAGFNVESQEYITLPNVVIAEVKQKIKHPSADRLSLCKVQAKNNKIHCIVCGASNFKVGDKVVLALPGAILPGGFTIKTRKVRGETSEGMLASLKELGLAKTDSGGIFVLPQEVKVGDDFDSYIGLKDIILDIDITPNRSDCLSHFGLARELSCILDQKLKVELITNNNSCTKKPFLSASKALGPSIKNRLGVTIKQAQLCPRYTGRAIYGVQVKPSPIWLIIALQNLGFKSINNIVDITNYFLLQYGQPLHAFDLDTLQNDIIVDFSQKNEIFTTLDQQDITLTGTELCIQDTKKPLALAGVIGGLNSGIQPNTKNIFVESACFEPIHVRKTAKKFNIETDSSNCFSRGIPFQPTLEMLHRAITIIQEVAGGVISHDEYDIKSTHSQIKNINIKATDISRRLGYEVDFLKFKNHMVKLNCKIQIQDDIAQVVPPFFRFDLNIKEDLIEEYARLEGYHKIPETISRLNGVPKSDHKEYTLSSHIEQILEHEGFYQAINHSFISQEFSDSFLKGSPPLFCGNKKISPIVIKNPLSKEHNMMRLSLVPSLFKNAQLSLRHGCLQGRLFELGKVFYSQKPELQGLQSPLDAQEPKLQELKSPLDVQEPKLQGLQSPLAAQEPELQELKSPLAAQEPKLQGLKSPLDAQKINNILPYKESSYLAFIAWGQEENLWKKNKDRLCIYDLKTAIQTVLEDFSICDYQWISDDNSPEFIHPYQYSVLKVHNKKVGYIGSLNPFYTETYKIKVNLAVAELNLNFLINSHNTKKPFQNLSSFPLVNRDLSFLIPKDFPVETIIKGIKQQAGSVCRNIEVFDIYTNKQLSEEGVRAVAFCLTLQSNTHTLTEENLKNIQKKITQEMVSKYPVKLR